MTFSRVGVGCLGYPLYMDMAHGLGNQRILTTPMTLWMNEPIFLEHPISVPDATHTPRGSTIMNSIRLASFWFCSLPFLRLAKSIFSWLTTRSNAANGFPGRNDPLTYVHEKTAINRLVTSVCPPFVFVITNPHADPKISGSSR